MKPDFSMGFAVERFEISRGPEVSIGKLILPPRGSIEEIRSTAEHECASRLKPTVAASRFGQRMVQIAGEEAVKRHLEQRARGRR